MSSPTPFSTRSLSKCLKFRSRWLFMKILTRKIWKKISPSCASVPLRRPKPSQIFQRQKVRRKKILRSVVLLNLLWKAIKPKNKSSWLKSRPLIWRKILFLIDLKTEVKKMTTALASNPLERMRWICHLLIWSSNPRPQVGKTTIWWTWNLPRETGLIGPCTIEGPCLEGSRSSKTQTLWHPRSSKNKISMLQIFMS